jgi:hypothetical protein
MKKMDENKKISNQTSTNVESTLDVLGNIIVIAGAIVGLILIFYGIAEDFIFIVAYGAALLFSSLISGYLLKGVAKIIILLSLNIAHSSDQNIPGTETLNTNDDIEDLDENSMTGLIDDDFRDELIDKRSLSELKKKFDELNSMNWNYMTKAQKDLREKLANKIQYYDS